MRAAVLTARRRDRARGARRCPTPGPARGAGRDQRSVGVCGSDIHYYEHGRIGAFVVEAPLILGHESAGRVAAVGERGHQARRRRPRDARARRARAGAAASAAPAGTTSARTSCSSPRRRSTARSPTTSAIHEDFAFALPDALSDDVGALMEPLSVGIWACRKAGVTRGRPRAGHRRRADRPARDAGRAGVRRHAGRDLRRQRDRLALAARTGATRTLVAGRDEPVEADVLIECSGHPAAVAAGIERAAAGGHRGARRAWARARPASSRWRRSRRASSGDGHVPLREHLSGGDRAGGDGRVDLEAIITGHYGSRRRRTRLRAGREDPGSVKVMVHP